MLLCRKVKHVTFVTKKFFAVKLILKSTAAASQTLLGENDHVYRVNESSLIVAKTRLLLK